MKKALLLFLASFFVASIVCARTSRVRAPWSGDKKMTWPVSPKYWNVTTGTWGTDIDRDESTIYTGPYSLNMIDTAVATEIRSDLIPWIGGGTEFVTVFAQQDDITAGNTITVEVYGYASDRVTVPAGENATLFSGVLTAANTWEFVGGKFESNDASTKFIQIRIKKSAVAFNVFIDHVWTEVQQPSWNLYLDEASATTITTGTWTTVPCANESGDAGGNSIRAWIVSHSSGVVTIRHAGSYAMSASVEFDTASDGTAMDIRIKMTDGVTTKYRYGTRTINGAAGNARVMVSTTDEHLAPGDTVEVQVYHDEGSDLDLVDASSSDSYSFFTGHRNAKGF